MRGRILLPLAVTAAFVAGCEPVSDDHLPVEDQVANAVGSQWIGGGLAGDLCLAKTAVDPNYRQHSEYDPATMEVDTDNQSLTLTAALGDVSIRMLYTVTIEDGKTSIATGPADGATRDFMLSQGCVLPE